MNPGFDLPDFPWDSLAEAKAHAAVHPGGLVDLSVGSPADPVSDSVRDALAQASNAHSYPTTAGIPALRSAIVDAFHRDYGVAVHDVLPVIGAKEAIAWLPLLLGARESDTVVIPTLAYPTYEVAAKLARAEVIRADHPGELPALKKPPVVWFLNSPANPHGAVASPEVLRDVVEWARAKGTVVVSDECYLRFGWEGRVVSALHPEVAGNDQTGIIALHSLSKVANLAGYRAGFITGDPSLVKGLLELRRHAGMIIPAPIQAAVVAALNDSAALDAQRERYKARRETLRASLVEAGFKIDYSQGGLYLWATRAEDCFSTVNWCAERGILVAPGSFYGSKGDHHVRVALTATDEHISAVAQRLA